MLRHAPSSSSPASKPVDFFRPLIVDVSVEYELPKEVAPPPGSAPLLIIHPSAYYPARGGSNKAANPTSILSPSPIRTSSFNAASTNSSSSSSSYYLRSANNNNSSNNVANISANVYGQNQNGQTGITSTRASSYSTSTSVSRSRSMSLAVGSGRGGRSIQAQGQGQSGSNTTTSTSTNTINTTNCTDPSCDQCYVQQPTVPQLMELDLTPSNHKSTSTSVSSKRLRRDRDRGQGQDRENQLLDSSSLHPQPLNLTAAAASAAAANMYLGPSLAYVSSTPPISAMPSLPLSNPLYGRKSSVGSQHVNVGVVGGGLGMGPGAQNGIFQMINNVYAQQQLQQNHLNSQQFNQQQIVAQSERLLLKEHQGPKGSGSDSGVCSENESDVSPTNNNNSSSSSRRNLFAHEGSGGGAGSGTTGCYCCCCPPTNGSTASNSPPRRNTSTNSRSATSSSNSSSSTLTSSSSATKSRDRGNDRSTGRNTRTSTAKSTSISTNQQQLQLIHTALPHPHPHQTQPHFSHTHTHTINHSHPYSSYMGLGLPSSPMAMDSSHDAMMIVPMDSSPAASYHHRAKWFVPPTSTDFGRWFQV